MASFCKQCAEELGFESDFAGMFTHYAEKVKDGWGFNVLCETCGGAFIVDDEGTCGSPDCNNLHGTDTPLVTGSLQWKWRVDEFNRLLMGNK